MFPARVQTRLLSMALPSCPGKKSEIADREKIAQSWKDKEVQRDMHGFPWVPIPGTETLAQLLNH